MPEVRPDNNSHRARVVEIIEETGDAHSVVLEVEDTDAFGYSSGQFLTVAVPSDRTGVVARCYSLSSAPHETDLLKITVKRTADGYGSNWICDNLRAGQQLTVLPPSGIFTPKSYDADLLLFAGGSGITPVISIAKTALATGSGKVVLLYANRDESSVIFAAALTELAQKHPDRFVVVHWLESVQGLPSAEHMRAFAEHFTTYDAFVCGPGPFMQGVVEALKGLGFPRERRHQEKFVSLGGNPFGDEAFVVDEGDEPLEEALRRSAPATVAGDLDGQDFTFGDWPPTRSSSTSCSRRDSTRRTPAGRATAAPVRSGWSRERSPCCATTCSRPRTSTRGSDSRASRSRSATP